MQLETYLSSIVESSDSYFQSHLAREDLERVRKLRDLAVEASDVDALQKQALYIGWTPGDLRTVELKHVLTPLIAATFDLVKADPDLRAGPNTELNAAVMEAWKAFHQERIKILIHCL